MENTTNLGFSEFKEKLKNLLADSNQPQVQQLFAAEKQAYEDFRKTIKPYRVEEERLQEASQLSGLQGLAAKKQLSQLKTSPLYQQINQTKTIYTTLANQLSQAIQKYLTTIS